MQPDESQLVKKVKRTLARHGLDAPEWSEAISSQYFLTKIAKVLDMTEQQDFLSLYDKFLASFRVRYDDTLVLEADRVLITPDETKNMIASMKNEDDQGGQYSATARLKADSINAQLMHLNYHYALLLEIASSRDTSYSRAIQDICLRKLKAAECLDAWGGWYPYRTPWLTARIIISLHESGSVCRDEAVRLITDKAVDSLVDRLDDSGLWLSGAGSWVSDIESTALCLEALLISGRINFQEKPFDNVLRVASSNLQKGYDSISFSSEAKVNESLALTVLGSVLHQIDKAIVEFKRDYFVSR